MNDRMKVGVTRLALGVVLGLVAALGLSGDSDSGFHDISEVLLFCAVVAAVWGIGTCVIALFRETST